MRAPVIALFVALVCVMRAPCIEVDVSSVSPLRDWSSLVDPEIVLVDTLLGGPSLDCEWYCIRVASRSEESRADLSVVIGFDQAGESKVLSVDDGREVSVDRSSALESALAAVFRQMTNRSPRAYARLAEVLAAWLVNPDRAKGPFLEAFLSAREEYYEHACGLARTDPSGAQRELAAAVIIPHFRVVDATLSEAVKVVQVAADANAGDGARIRMRVDIDAQSLAEVGVTNRASVDMRRASVLSILKYLADTFHVQLRFDGDTILFVTGVRAAPVDARSPLKGGSDE